MDQASEAEKGDALSSVGTVLKPGCPAGWAWLGLAALLEGIGTWLWTQARD